MILAGAPRDIILIHGRDDRIIPREREHRLAAALPAERGHLYVVEHLAHADLEPGDWRDDAHAVAGDLPAAARCATAASEGERFDRNEREPFVARYQPTSAPRSSPASERREASR